ncbi:MAG: ribosome assembly cofactor RimP [Paramuribaculum sp.]|nr:ribosome assembly cofactor RimP [Paramuribaculum sp.]
MIDKQKLYATVEQAIANTDAFIVDVTVTPDNIVTVEIDSPTGVDLDACVDINRKIEDAFDRDVEDYSLEVGSAGLTAPFKVLGQYLKNIGNTVEVLTRDGRKLRGILKAVEPDCSAFTITIGRKVKEPGAKRPVLKQEDETIAVADTKEVKYYIDFK